MKIFSFMTTKHHPYNGINFLIQTSQILFIWGSMERSSDSFLQTIHISKWKS